MTPIASWGSLHTRRPTGSRYRRPSAHRAGLHEATGPRSTMSMLALFREIFPGVPQNPVQRNAAGTVISH